VVKLEPRAARRRAAVFVIFAAVLWWLEWMPALLVLAFVAWLIVHKRFEGEYGDDLRSVRQRFWPPATIVLIALIVAGTAVYGMSNRALEAKMLPIALNVIALFTLIRGIRWPFVASREPAVVSLLS
jgi:hypothetical protein